MAKTYNTVPDKAAGDTFTEAMWDDYVKTNGNNLIVPASCRVTQSGGTSLSDNTETTVAFASEAWDTDSMHDTVTNNSRITIQTAGVYLITAGLGVTVATEVLAAMLRVNGSTYIARNQDAMTTSAFAQYVTVVAAYSFAAADYVELRALQDNTANTSRTTDTTFTWMSAVWLGKAS